ncbi:MAG: NAD(P)H-hydrate dehydratase [Thermoplasmata archaeon]|nr:NAD(P)H-hydrate dehydratase [Thermoplasmata archaeon]
MLPLIEFRVLDINSECLGVSRERLMVNAGRAVAEVIQQRFDVRKILVVCGTGNNGGDGFAMAGLLGKTHDVTVCLMERPERIKTEIAKKQFRNCRKNCNVEMWDKIDGMLKRTEIVVDAIFGTGLTRMPEGKYAAVIEKINEAGKPVVSVDVPSGFPYEMAVKPTLTVTFHDMKEGMNPANSGEVVVMPIGIPPEAETETNFGEFVLYKVPDNNSRKGDNGRVLVVGGGPYTGAPYFVAMAAYRTGVDLVHVATQPEAYEILRNYSPLFIVHQMPEDAERRIEFLLNLHKKFDVVVVGPGLGKAGKIMETCREFISAAEKPIVVDADAISLLRDVRPKSNALVTPHAGEFFELTGRKVPENLEERVEIVKEAAKNLGCTVLLKGAVDLISDGVRAKINRTGNPGMTVGGTGDVLAGICAALIAKGCTPYQAARLGAFISGLTGDAAFEKYGYSLLPTDIIDQLPEVIRKGLNKTID